MNTSLASILFYRQSQSNDELEDFYILIEELRAVAEKHGYKLAEYEADILTNEEPPIGPCDRCKYLTLGRPPTEEELRDFEVLSRFERVLHKGRVEAGSFICNECEQYTKSA